MESNSFMAIGRAFHILVALLFIPMSVLNLKSLVSDRDKLKVEKALSSELNKICTWLNDNKLSISGGPITALPCYVNARL